MSDTLISIFALRTSYIVFLHFLPEEVINHIQSRVEPFEPALWDADSILDTFGLPKGLPFDSTRLMVDSKFKSNLETPTHLIPSIGWGGITLRSQRSRSDNVLLISDLDSRSLNLQPCAVEQIKKDSPASGLNHSKSDLQHLISK